MLTIQIFTSNGGQQLLRLPNIREMRCQCSPIYTKKRAKQQDWTKNGKHQSHLIDKMVFNTKEKTILKNTILVFLTLSFVLTTSAAFGKGSYGDAVNTYCPSPDPYTGDCTLCHAGSKGNPTPMKDAYNADTLEYFCPAPVDPNTI
jgi:hypothetical protein